MRRTFDIKRYGVTYTIEFELNHMGEVEDFCVFVGDSPDIGDIVRDDVMREFNEECYNHLPEVEVEND